MRLKYRILARLQYLAFAFYPKTTVLVCIISTVVINVCFGLVMSHVHNRDVYNVLLSVMTGATASFMVSIAVELSNNYKNNKLAWHELQAYYSVISDYEMTKQVHMAQTPHQRAEAKAREEFVAAGGNAEGQDNIDEEDIPKDLVQATWEQLPKIIPVLKKTLEEKKAFLTDGEITILRNLLGDYKKIRTEVFHKVMMPLLYNSLNHPDEEYLKGLYPRNIIADIPDWMRSQIASIESKSAIERLTDAIMDDDFLLRQYMKGYDISLKAIESYKSPSDDESNDFSVSDDVDEYDYAEEADEETFKAQQAELDRQMEEERKTFVSWHISQCCLNIAQDIDELEKHIVTKPYVGWQIKMDRNASKEKLDDPVSKIVYERKTRELKHSETDSRQAGK